MKDWRTISSEVDEGRKTILPFAGVYPTRWKIEGRYSLSKRRPDTIFRYLGKPNRKIAERVRMLMARSHCCLFEAWEFDRLGGLAYGRCPIIGRIDILVQSWNDVFRFYYPWSTHNAHMITTWCARFMHRVPVTFQGRIHMLYSPYRQEEVDDVSWVTHKTWLNSVNLQLGKRPTTSTNP